MNRFPWYVQEPDEMAMAMMCPVELARWRRTREDHKALPSVNKKLNHRRELERAFEMLKMAWEMASVPAEVAMAA